MNNEEIVEGISNKGFLIVITLMILLLIITNSFIYFYLLNNKIETAYQESKDFTETSEFAELNTTINYLNGWMDALDYYKAMLFKGSNVSFFGVVKK